MEKDQTIEKIYPDSTISSSPAILASILVEVKSFTADAKNVIQLPLTVEPALQMVELI